jgi:hypothetical protein
MTIFLSREEWAKIVARSTRGVKACILLAVEIDFEIRFMELDHVCHDDD